jgi:hypothetical protein
MIEAGRESDLKPKLKEFLTNIVKAASAMETKGCPLQDSMQIRVRTE